MRVKAEVTLCFSHKTQKPISYMKSSTVPSARTRSAELQEGPWIMFWFRDKFRRKILRNECFLKKEGFKQSLSVNKKLILMDESEKTQPFTDK